MTTMTSALAMLPSPRRIRRRRGHLQIVLSHVQLIALLLFIQVAWQIALGQIKLQFCGILLPARITKVWTTPGDEGPSHEISVSYCFEDAAYANKLAINSEEAKVYKVGHTVTVEVLAERPDRPMLYRADYPFWFVTIFCCVFCLLPPIGLCKLLWDLYVAPWRLRHVLREGEDVAGIIVDKKELTGRAPSYTLTYQYSLPVSHGWERDVSTSAPLRATMKVPKDDGQEVQIGDAVVVLYHPKHPRRSVLPRFADYAILPLV